MVIVHVGGQWVCGLVVGGGGGAHRLGGRLADAGAGGLLRRGGLILVVGRLGH